MGWEVKNHIRDQSKHGLSGSSVKIGKFYLGPDRNELCVLFWAQNIKNAIWDRTPLLHTNPSLCEYRSECPEITNLQTELNYLN